MSDPYLGEIRLFPFDRNIPGWAQCKGQFLRIDMNAALFSLIGFTYGGDGVTYFAVPDLSGKTPIHRSGAHPVGEEGGVTSVGSWPTDLPRHTHTVAASTATTGGNSSPANRFLGGGNHMYHDPANLTTMRPTALASVGGGQPHPNMQPYLALNFYIAVAGIYPTT